jgi:hypothetical protein
MPKTLNDMYDRTVQVVREMRANHTSRRTAAQMFGVTPQVVSAFAGTALRKRMNGRYVAAPTDKLLRVLVIPRAQQGLVEIATTDSREATKLSNYWKAIGLYVGEKRDPGPLKQFVNQFIIDAKGRRVPLLTDLDEIDLLASAGVLSFETIYANR